MPRTFEDIIGSDVKQTERLVEGKRTFEDIVSAKTMMPINRYGSGFDVNFPDLPDYKFTEEYKERMENSLYYSSQFGISPELSFDLEPELTRSNDAILKNLGLKSDKDEVLDISEKKELPVSSVFNNIDYYKKEDEKQREVDSTFSKLMKVTAGTFLSVFPSPVGIPAGIVVLNTRKEDIILGMYDAIAKIHGEKEAAKNKKYPFVAAGMGGFDPNITRESVVSMPLNPLVALKEIGKGVGRFGYGLGGAFGGTAYDWLGQFIAQGGVEIDRLSKLGAKNPDRIYNPYAEAIIATGQNISKWGKESRAVYASHQVYGWAALDPLLRKTDPVSYYSGALSEGVTSSGLSVLAMYLSGGATVAPELLNRVHQINRGLLLLSGLSAAGGFQHAQEQKENFFWSTLAALADGTTEYVGETTFLEGVGKGKSAVTTGFKESAQELFTGMIQNTRAGILENDKKGMSAYEAVKDAFKKALKKAPLETVAGFIGGWGTQGGANLVNLVNNAISQPVVSAEKPPQVKTGAEVIAKKPEVGIAQEARTIPPTVPEAVPEAVQPPGVETVAALPTVDWFTGKPRQSIELNPVFSDIHQVAQQRVTEAYQFMTMETRDDKLVKGYKNGPGMPGSEMRKQYEEAFQRAILEQETKKAVQPPGVEKQAGIAPPVEAVGKPAENRFKEVPTNQKEAILKQYYEMLSPDELASEKFRPLYEEIKESFTKEEQEEFKAVTGVLDKRIAQILKKVPITKPIAKPSLTAQAISKITGTEEGKPTEPERKVSRAAERIQEEAIAKDLAESLGELPTYDVMNMAEQAKMVADEINKDYETAKQMAYGKIATPSGIRPASIYRGIAVKARTEGDVETLRNLAVVHPQISLELTAMGQAVKAADVGISEVDPVKAMQDIQKTREKAVKKKRKIKDITKQKKAWAKEAKEEIRKQTTKRQSWTEFVESIRC